MSKAQKQELRGSARTPGVKLSVRLPAWLKQAVVEHSKRTGQTVDEFVIVMLNESIPRIEPKELWQIPMQASARRT